jgi:hypothetical protein
MGYVIAWESTFGSEEPAGWDGAMASCPACPLNGVAHIVVALREPGGTCSSLIKRMSSEVGSDLVISARPCPELSRFSLASRTRHAASRVVVDQSRWLRDRILQGFRELGASDLRPQRVQPRLRFT